MSRLDDLPADQKATLQLLLKQGKSYDELATLLRLDPSAVRERALNALDALGPDTVGGLTPTRQDEVSDYLLGQQSAAADVASRSFLAGSAAAQAWARAVATELQTLAGDALPDIPAEEPDVEQTADTPAAPRGETRERPEPSSKVGGVLLLLGVAAIIAVLVVLIVSRLGEDDNTRTTADAPPATAQTSTGTSTTTDPNGGIELQVAMSSTKSNALAAAFVLKQDGERALGINGQNFAPTDNKRFSYAVWLYTSPQKAVRLGFVGAGVAAKGQDKGRLEIQAAPAQIEQAAAASKSAKDKAALRQTAKDIRTALKRISSFKELIITREPIGKTAETPGPIVVSGPIVTPR